MRPQAHIAASLVVWTSGPRHLAEAPACALAGNLPDFDRNVAKALGVRRRDHHRWVSHSLIGWLPPTLLAGRALRGTRVEGAGRRAIACLWLHLLLDSYADGIAWLWPLHKDKIGLFRKPREIVDDGWNTPAPLSTEMGKLEAAMWLAVVAGLLR